MSEVKFNQVEYHQVHLHKTMCISEEDILENSSMTVERFKEVLSHQNTGFSADPIGEEPTDEECDEFYDLVSSWAECHDTEEDWFTDRKGGYEIDYSLIEEEDE